MDEQVLLDAEGCYVVLVPSFLSPDECKPIWDDVMASGPRQLPVVMNGIERLQPRLVAWYATDQGMAYTYSGLTLKPQAFPATVEPLRTRLESMLGVSLPTCLTNVYRDGRDSVGIHSDLEYVLGPNPMIVSVSMGQARTFRLMKKADKSKIDVKLGQGDLLIMAGATQSKWRHEVPKEPTITEPRISLTFRPYVMSKG